MRVKRSKLYPALAAAAALSLVLIPAAGSANGDPMIIGVLNTGSAVTTLLTSAEVGYAVVDIANTANTIAIQGTTGAAASGAIAVLGSGSNTDPNEGSVVGQNNSASSIAVGVQGISTNGFGGRFTATGPAGWGVQGAGGIYGVRGDSHATNLVNTAGVSGTITSNADYSGGVRGDNFGTNCCGFGVVGFHSGQGIGIGGYAPDGFGVFGYSPKNWAAYFDGAVQVVGDLQVKGTLYKAGGAFRIDNPLDPAHSYLQHSFVESPQMMNVYNGNVLTDAKGHATVQLPKWFQTLNKDFRYQLTVMGRSFAQAIVWKKMAHNQFAIKTNQPHTQVSWQVTGVRHDPYANAHRIQVIVPKTGSASGKYEHPLLYGQPASKGVTALPAGLRYSKQAAMAPRLKTK